jgi:hypothetical protein
MKSLSIKKILKPIKNHVMKKTKIFTIVIGLILQITFFKTIAQENNTLFYQTRADHNFNECDANGLAIAARANIPVPGGSRFTIMQRAGDNYVIKFWDWQYETIPGASNINAFLTLPATIAARNLASPAPIPVLDNNKILQYNYYLDAGIIHQRYFLISEADLKLYAEPLVKHWGATVGNLAMPIKYRFKSDEVSKDFTFSSMGGFKYTWRNDVSVCLIGGVGLASVNLDSTNSSLKISSERSAISMPFGIVLQYKILQIGAVYGFDYLIKNNEANWINHKRSWFSIGIGLAIFTDSKEEEKEGKQ